MRFVLAIIACLLVQTGLLARVLADGGCCPTSEMESSHADSHQHGDESGHSHGECPMDLNDSDSDLCPKHCGEHHHHHGTCIHALQMSVIVDHLFRLIPPHSTMIGCDGSHMQAPDGPVFELDKPPLI